MNMLWIDYGHVKVLVGHSLEIMLCFYHSLFLFIIMNCIDYILYVLYTVYESSKLDYGFHVMIMDVI